MLSFLFPLTRILVPGGKDIGVSYLLSPGTYNNKHHEAHSKHQATRFELNEHIFKLSPTF